jgi:hypothetical protein
MRKAVSFVLIFIIIVMQSGCSMFAPRRQKMSVTASERDAAIYINGEFIENGNVTTRVPRNQSVSIMAKKEGCYTATREIDTTMSMTGILDIIGGWCFLLPFIGLMFPGARELDTNNVAIVLEKEGNQAK